MPTTESAYLDILLKLALALALGLLLGLERERRGKEAGLRTFGFISLLGALGGFLGHPFAALCLVLTGGLAIPLNVQTLKNGAGTELTTSAAMLITCMAGILCGLGHTITPAAVMVSVTALLAWKEPLAGFSMGLTEGEVRSAVLLAILAIVIYPALPVGAVGPWQLIEPRAAWITVILIASIGFVNYILWKIYGARGTEISGFFGGLVNSNFTVLEMVSRVQESSGRFAGEAYRGILVAVTAMIVRNATLLLILAPLALANALSAFALMILGAAAMVMRAYVRRKEAALDTDIHLALPFSLPVALRYGALFLVLHVVGRLMQREFGETGFYVVTVVGGLLSSASAVAAAASMSSQGAVSPLVAGNGAVLASITSLCFSLFFVFRTKQTKMVTHLTVAVLTVAALGAAGIAFNGMLQPILSAWLPWH